jgi:hypothetical protein
MIRDLRRIEVVEDAMAAVLRQKTEAERLAIAFRMWSFARDMTARQVRSDCPDLPESEVKRIVAGRLSHGAC